MIFEAQSYSMSSTLCALLTASLAFLLDPQKAPAIEDIFGRGTVVSCLYACKIALWE